MHTDASSMPDISDSRSEVPGWLAHGLCAPPYLCHVACQWLDLKVGAQRRQQRCAPALGIAARVFQEKAVLQGVALCDKMCERRAVCPG